MRYKFRVGVRKASRQMARILNRFLMSTDIPGLKGKRPVVTPEDTTALVKDWLKSKGWLKKDVVDEEPEDAVPGEEPEESVPSEEPPEPKVRPGKKSKTSTD